MSEPTIGDTVRVLDVPTIEFTGYEVGMIGTVIEDRPPMVLRYYVEFEDCRGFFRPSELQKVWY